MTHAGARIVALVTICVTAAVIAHAQSTTSVDALLKRIQALEKRVDDLEKFRIGIAGGSGANGQSAPPPKPAPSTSSARPSRLQAPLEIVDNGVVVASIVATGEGRAKLTLGNEARGAVMAGTGNSGNGYIVVHGKDGKPAIDMGTGSGRPMGVYVLGADGVRVQAGLGIDESQRGILRIGEPAGLRGTLGFTKSGNGISFGLFDKPGPDARVALYAAADGSSLQLKSPSGGIDLNTDGTGSLLGLSNVKGSAAVALEMRTSGAGRVTIGDAAGNTVVEAGVTIEGLGVVRAGPDLGGTTGAMSGGLVVPRAILGRRAK